MHLCVTTAFVFRSLSFMISGFKELYTPMAGMLAAYYWQLNLKSFPDMHHLGPEKERTIIE